MRRQISLLLAVVMALSIWTNVFANEPELNLESTDDFMRVREEIIQEQMKQADKSDQFIVKYKNAGAKKNAAAVVQSAFAKGKAKNEVERQQLEAKISKFDDIQKRELNMYTSSQSQSVKVAAKTGMASKKISASLTEVIELDEPVDPDDFIKDFKAEMGDSIAYIQSDIKMELSTTLTEFDVGLIVDNPEKLTGSDKIVAVIDTGVDVTHPTLAPRVTKGYDFVNNTGDVYNPKLGAEQDHGTHISGIIAGTVENVQIMPLKVFENGSAYTSDIIAAVEHAEANGASVVNCSWGATGENPALREAMENSSMFFVCAAGNSRLDLGETPIYPSAFNLPNSISVASVNQDLGMSYFSNYGSVDIAAKGRDIISAVAGGGYRDMNGTSMAAAYVSAAAALADGDIKAALMASADKLSCLQGKVADGNYMNIENLIAGIVGQTITVTPEDDFDRWFEKTPAENWELFNASPTVQVVSENHRTLALKANGTVFAWGMNNVKQLGVGLSTNSVLIPTQVIGLTNIQAISAGDHHTAALDFDGYVHTWGSNSYGEIGNGSSSWAQTPYKITSISNIQSIVANNMNTFALDTAGYIYAWGANHNGQTLNGSPDTEVLSPYKITSISNIKAVSFGGSHAAALGNDGYVYTWGNNYNGEIGNGYPGENVLSPYKVTSISNIKAVSAGYYHTVALGNDGYVYAWGNNGAGEIGNGSYGSNVLSPYKITSITNIKAISAGNHLTTALGNDGYVHAWGWNSQGQVGNGHSGWDILSPYKITNVSNIESISAGSLNTAALNSNGDVYVWGYNAYGQIGDGTTTNRLVPTLAGGFNVNEYIDFSIAVDEWDVIIDGATTAGNNKEVNLLVKNASSNAVVYDNQMLSGTNGLFAFNFSMPTNAPSGDYNVNISGEDGSGVFTDTFQYTQPPVVSINDITVDGCQVAISGITTAGVGKEVTLLVKNASSSATTYDEQTLSGSNGAFVFSFLMPSGAPDGTYNISVGGEDINIAATATFVYEAPVTPPVTELEYDITVNQRQVTISGTTPLGANKQVTLLVQNEQKNTIAYIDQMASGTDGTFVFSFLMPINAPNGIYNVKVGGEGISTPTTDTFEYESTVTPPLTELEYSITVNEQRVTISGITPYGANKQVTLLVQHSETNAIAYIDQIPSGIGGTFAFSFLMPANALSGIYNVKVGGEGIGSPAVTTFSYQKTMTSTAQVSGNIVTVSGTTPAGPQKAVTILVRDTNERIVYINQEDSRPDSGFTFVFRMPVDAVAGEYRVWIGGEGVETPEFLTFNYNEADFEVEYAWFNADITVQNYVVNINGTVECQEGRKVIVLIKEQGQGTEYMAEEIVGQDGEASFSCTLPSLLNTATYIIEVKSYETSLQGDVEITSLSAVIDTNILSLTANGTAYCSDGKRMVAVIRENNDLINKTVEITSEDEIYNISTSIPTLLCAGPLGFEVSAVFREIATVTNLTAPVFLPPQSSDVTDKTVLLNWHSSQGGTGEIKYSLYVNDTLYVSDISETSYEVQNLYHLTEYIFMIVALDAAGNVAESNVLSVTTRDSVEGIPITIPITADQITDEEEYGEFFGSGVLPHIVAEIYPVGSFDEYGYRANDAQPITTVTVAENFTAVLDVYLKYDLVIRCPGYTSRLYRNAQATIDGMFSIDNVTLWPGDTDDDGVVTQSDIERMLEAYNSTSPVPPECDLDKDGETDIWELMMALRHKGKYPYLHPKDKCTLVAQPDVKTVTVSKDGDLLISVDVNNVEDINKKTFTVYYDTNVLTLDDSMMQIYEGSPINIVCVGNGIIKFKRALGVNKWYSGSAIVIRFIGLTTGESEITLLCDKKVEENE